MNRSGVWIMGGLAATLVAVLPLVPRAAPQPVLPRPVLLADQSFAALCKDGVVVDSRPDPAWLLASYEGDNCRAPAMPTVPNGRAANREVILAGMAAVKAHAAQSRVFEKCITDFIALHKGPSLHGKSFALVETHRILTSEKNRKLAASRMAAAINAFNEYGSDCAD